MLRLSSNLFTIPKLSFTAGYTSQYTFKTQPAVQCLSTIETCYYVIGELQDNAVIPQTDAEPLMNIFHRLVNYQLDSEQKRRESGLSSRYSKNG